MVLTILGIVGSILTIVIWYLNRKRPPTKEELIQAIHLDEADTYDKIRKLRDEGNHAAADDMLFRIRQRGLSYWVPKS